MSSISPQPFNNTYAPGSSNNGTSSRKSTPPQQPPQHKRVYQACIPCRRRKVKCDLGSVDNPSDPPCVRCRRESKECYFSATRRKRKLPGGEDSVDGNGFDEEYLKRNGRKRLFSNDSGSEPPTSLREQSIGAGPFVSRPLSSSDISPQRPLTPGGHIGRNQPLRRPHRSIEESQQADKNNDDQNVQYENPEAQDVMRREVYGPHDALDLLYKAATDNPGHKRVRSEGNIQSSSLDSVSNFHRGPLKDISQFQPRSIDPPDAQRLMAMTDTTSSAPDGLDRASRMQDPGYRAAIKSWARFRFVRAGWFTPAEAIEYIEYYYTYLSPLTPISPPTFRNPETHHTLLTEEPILTVTLLTIASRYHKILGAGGNCRSHAIHEQMWTYLRGMVERCLWGQEAFGGGFCGSGATEGEQTSSTAPWRGLRKGSLRTLGTVESLMILTEWHPRALHFPPAEATDELMLPCYEAPDNYSTDEDGNNKLPGGVGGKRIESWLEPAWRSDRMCWMLLSNAMGLSFELGVFDQIDETGGDVTRPEYEDEAYRLRAARIKKLLLIYVTQLAGRLGWTNMVPEHLRQSDIMEMRKTKTSVDENTPGTSTTMSNAFNYIPDLELDDQIIHCWAGITNTMRWGNDKLFRSRKHTTAIIQSGRYIELLKEFRPMLDNWLRTFEGFRLPQHIRHILTIEFEYVRIYVNSLSLQAVVERCTNNAGNTGSGPGGNNAANLSPETQNYYGKLPLARLGGFGPADQEYVKEVVDGSRNLLRTVVDGLLPGEYLKHAPVRTYFRIISGAMFLLKTFALGASRNDVEVSIGLMDRAVAALRTCVVDDVHLGIRFSDLLETLTSRLRTRFMHAPTAQQVSNTLNNGQGSESRQETKPSKADKKDRRKSWNANATSLREQNSQGQNTNTPPTPFDINQNTFFPSTSYTSSNNVYDLQDSTFPSPDGWSSTTDMWYLPPGAAFFQNSDQAITQTAEGVNVGGIDLLDYMAMDQYPGMDANDMGSGF